MMYPEYLEELKRWARSNHRWLKRAAAVTLIIPARKGLELLTQLGHKVKHKSLLLRIMRKQRMHFDKAFKENAVKLSLERKNVSELAQELGIEPFLLYRWRKEFHEKGDLCFPGNGIQSLSEESKRIADLEKRLNDAEIERDILKKALGIISKSGR